MQVEAIYRNGHLEFTSPLRLKSDQVRVVVTVPDDEIESQATPFNLSPEVLARAQKIRGKLDAIRSAPPPPDSELPELTADHLERIEAFGRREER